MQVGMHTLCANAANAYSLFAACACKFCLSAKVSEQAPHEHWPSITWPPGKGYFVFGACGGIFYVGNILYQCEGNRMRACRAVDMTFEFTNVLVWSLSAPQVSICYSLLTHCCLTPVLLLTHCCLTPVSLLTHCCLTAPHSTS